MTKKEELELRCIWNKKLKESGFQDIEKWDGFSTRKKKQLHFIRSHIRWSDFKTKKNFHQTSEETFNYFRVLGLFAHHGPVTAKYKEILIEYTMCGSLSKAIRTIDPNIKHSATLEYIHRNFKKMLKFVNEELDDE